MLLGQTNYRAEEESALVQAFLGRRVDGLVLTGVNHARGVRSSILRAGIPVVETWDLSERPIHLLVGFSNHAAGFAAGRYLTGKGHKRLGYIGGTDGRSLARLQGFREAAQEAGASEVASIELAVPSSPADAGVALAELMGAAAPPRAIFCSNDMLAAGALFECARRRIAVPRDLAVMGFADLPIAASIEPAPDLGAGARRRDGPARRPDAAGAPRRRPIHPRIADLGFRSSNATAPEFSAFAVVSRAALPTASAVMLTMRRTVAEGVRM